MITVQAAGQNGKFRIAGVVSIRMILGILALVNNVDLPERGCMHHHYLIFPLLFASIASFSGEAFSAQPDVPVNAARIRVFQEAEITLYPGEYCYGSNSPQAIRASDGSPSFFSFNTKIGMPVTDDTPSAYNEYAIRANMPMTVMLQWQAEKNGLKANCGPIGSTFYPQTGRDYDVSISYTGSCLVRIRELYEASPGKATASLVPTSPSFACAR